MSVTKKKPQPQVVRAKSLNVDPDVQRVLDMERVAKMAASWDAAYVGTLTVSKRANGALYVIDGQHRLRAAEAAGLYTFSFNCLVFDGLSTEEEAALGLGINDFKKHSASEKYMLGVLANDPVYVAVNDAVVAAGCDYGHDTLRCASALVAAYKYGGSDSVTNALLTITTAFNGDPARFNNAVVQGMAAYFTANPTADPKVVAHKLARQRLGITATRLYVAAVNRCAGGGGGGSRWKAVRDIVAEVVAK